MEFYLNSCVLDEVKEINEWGILDGVTMNPSMMAAVGGDFKKIFTDICKTVSCKVFSQVTSTDADTMVEEAKIINSLGDNVVVKVQTSIEGIKAMKKIKETTDIEICATAIHTTMEALTVAKAGADHAAIFLGLLGEADERSTNDLMQGVMEAYMAAGIETRVMTAGRSLQQIVDGFRMGADEMTCAYSMWKLFFANSYTIDRWAKFEGAWKKAFGDRNWITG